MDLCSSTAPLLAWALDPIFTLVGLPKQNLLTDKGSNFMSKVLLVHLCRTLGVQPLQTSVYHPHTNRLVECLISTLKCILGRFVLTNSSLLTLLVVSTSFSGLQSAPSIPRIFPFESLFGCRPQGMLDLLKEEWEQPDNSAKGPSHFVEELKDNLEQVIALAHRSLALAKAKEQAWYTSEPSLESLNLGKRFAVITLPREQALN